MRLMVLWPYSGINFPSPRRVFAPRYRAFIYTDTVSNLTSLISLIRIAFYASRCFVEDADTTFRHDAVNQVQRD